MTIDKSALFASTMALWPSSIDIIKDPTGTHDIYWALEKIVSAKDDWQQIAMWSFHQALGELEKQAAATGASIISPHALTFDAFDKWMRFNLAGDECWATEQAIWQGSKAAE
jgi:hypothetical protein